MGNSLASTTKIQQPSVRVWQLPPRLCCGFGKGLIAHWFASILHPRNLSKLWSLSTPMESTLKVLVWVSKIMKRNKSSLLGIYLTESQLIHPSFYDVRVLHPFAAIVPPWKRRKGLLNTFQKKDPSSIHRRLYIQYMFHESWKPNKRHKLKKDGVVIDLWMYGSD